GMQQGGMQQGGMQQGGMQQGGMQQGGMQQGDMQQGDMQQGGMQQGMKQGGMQQDTGEYSVGGHPVVESEEMTESGESSGQRGGVEGHKGGRPPLEDLTQTVETTEDGSIVIALSGMDPEGDIRSNTITLSETEEGVIEIQSLKDNGCEKTVVVSEDSEDGGVDLDIVVTREEGEAVAHHIELDVTEDGTLSFITLTTVGEETFTREHEVELAQFLGEDNEVLNVLEVVEAYLEKGPIDMSTIDLSVLGDAPAIDDALLLV
ncbi:MAG: hypothetical protein OIF57_00625, partial [Marinobacterium sp.]|nr:hypothetical protein [Marinobacterium sp.]